ncbi:Hint domain-containing protein [Pseudooceanicola sp. 200-1SW]|uniref:Hint domain-containing protein n=1 Tax=Pseudooceanicola sp. 200-1SW TaxID=3425949 RepID=UPI003D7FEE93
MTDSQHRPAEVETGTAPLSGLGPGCMVLTLDGEMPIEWLAPGDKVITRDHGAQPVLHIARLRQAPGGGPLPAPLTFHPGERGPQGELLETLRVAPGHRALLRRPEIRAQFGTREALARFCDISRRNRARPDPNMGGLSYHQVILERHEIISAGSLWVESAGPEVAAQLDLPPAVRRATRLLDPDHATARPCLSRDEALQLRQLCPADLSLLDLLAA